MLNTLMNNMFSSEFKGHLFNAVLELDYLLDSGTDICTYKNEANNIINNVEFLLMCHNGNFAEAFELDNEYGDNPGVDMVISGYYNIKSALRKFYSISEEI